MAKWRSVAIELLPELRETIASAQNIMSLWIELTCKFQLAYDKPPDEDLIRRIYSYANWCWRAPRQDDAEHDPSTAATVAFFEHIPQFPAAWEDMPRYFTFAEIAAQKEGWFAHALGDKAFKSLLAHMQRNAHRYVGRSL